MTRFLSVLFACAACNAPTPARTAPVTVRADVSVDAAARTAPALHLLPALSEDGKRVAVTSHVDDGARGRDNLTLILVDAQTGRHVQELVIVDPNEDPETQAAKRAAREAEANRILASEHWTPLVKYDVSENSDAPERQGMMGQIFHPAIAKGEGLTVDYREPLLVVRDDAGRELLHRNAPSFSFPAGPRCKGCPPCAALADMQAVYGARARGVLLVVVAYKGGTDTCWEPDQTVHVVRIDPKPR